MTIPKNYFHDRLVLLLISICVFLALASSLWIILRLDSSHSAGYIVQYRASLGIGAFKSGSVLDLLGFVVFAAIVLATHIILSMRTYHIHRQLSAVILGLGALLLLLSTIVGNALLALR